MAAEHFTKDLHELEGDTSSVIGDIETCKYLLSGIIQNLGVDNDEVNTVIACDATLERAAANLEKVEDGLHRLITGTPSNEPEGQVEDSSSSTDEEPTTYSALNPEERALVDALRENPSLREAIEALTVLDRQPLPPQQTTASAKPAEPSEEERAREIEHEHGIMLLHATLYDIRHRWVNVNLDERTNAMLLQQMATLGRAGQMIDQTGAGCFSDWLEVTNAR